LNSKPPTTHYFTGDFGSSLDQSLALTTRQALESDVVQFLADRATHGRLDTPTPDVLA